MTGMDNMLKGARIVKVVDCTGLETSVINAESESKEQEYLQQCLRRILITIRTWAAVTLCSNSQFFC
jgi:hypothetical protein